MGVDDDPETTTTEHGASFPKCPHCGAAVVATTVIEPAIGTAVPCGCQVIPPALEFEE